MDSSRQQEMLLNIHKQWEEGWRDVIWTIKTTEGVADYSLTGDVGGGDKTSSSSIQCRCRQPLARSAINESIIC